MSLLYTSRETTLQDDARDTHGKGKVLCMTNKHISSPLSFSERGERIASLHAHLNIHDMK